MYIVYSPPDITKSEGSIDYTFPTTFCSCGQIVWDTTLCQDFGDGSICSIDIHHVRCSGNNDCSNQKVLAKLTWDDIRLNHMILRQRLKFRLRKQYAAPHYPTRETLFANMFTDNIFLAEVCLVRRLSNG